MQPSENKFFSVFKIRVIIIGLCLVSISVWLMYYIPTSIIETREREALDKLQIQLKQNDKLRLYLSDAYVKTIHAHTDLVVGIQHQTSTKHVPGVVTAFLDLNQEFNQIDDRFQSDLFSPYPFPNRDRPALTDFQLDLWEKVNQEPNTVFSGQRVVNGETFVYVAKADKLFSPHCVSCHNNLPISPKTGWKLGDVRAVSYASKNIQSIIDSSHKITQHVIILLFISCVLLTLFILLSYRREEYVAKTKYLAEHDNLTGLPNRRALRKYIQRHILNNDELSAYLFIDLDNFKPINDTFGHNIGDLVLQTTAQRIRRITRRDDFAARIGGDEFSIVMHHIKTPDDAEELAKRLISDVCTPISDANISIDLGCSIGIKCIDKNDKDIDAIIKDADNAMYRAKRRGKNQYDFAYKTQVIEENNLPTALSDSQTPTR